MQEGTGAGAGLDDDDDAVAEGAGDAGIGDKEHGGGINDDPVVVGLHLLYKLTHARGAEQLGGVGRDGAGGHDIQMAIGCRIDLDAVDGIAPAAFADEDAGHSFDAFNTEGAMNHGAMEIGIDQHDMFAGLGDREGHVAAGGGFALLRAARRDGDGFDRVGGDGIEQAGANAAVGLGDRGD